MDKRKTIASQKVEAYLRDRGISMNKLALELGVDRSQIMRWIDGTTTPQFRDQARINRVFGIINEWVEKG